MPSSSDDDGSSKKAHHTIIDFSRVDIRGHIGAIKLGDQTEDEFKIKAIKFRYK